MPVVQGERMLVDRVSVLSVGRVSVPCCGQGHRHMFRTVSPCPTAEADFSKASIRSFNMLCTG